VNASLVRQGLAWAFVKYSNAYISEEAEAKAARRGVFAAKNEPPWEFRADRWEAATKSAAAVNKRCPIKGNVSRSGERIYHMPWQSSYGKTVINEAKGERWLCDEREAERARWHRTAGRSHTGSGGTPPQSRYKQPTSLDAKPCHAACGRTCFMVQRPRLIARLAPRNRVR
jgi:hypothetical protein